VGTVIRRIDEDRVIADPKLVDLGENGTHVLVMIDHDVVVDVLVGIRLSHTRRFRMGAKMHMGEADPDEEGFVRLDLTIDEIG
jgi:hypothetical protein